MIDHSYISKKQKYDLEIWKLAGIFKSIVTWMYNEQPH